MNTKKTGIIGAGTMGIGIAQVAATNGCEVFLYDANAEQTEKSLQNLESVLQKSAAKGKISFEEAEHIFNRIKFCTELKDLKDCELVIEAAVENKDIKTKIFAELEHYVSETCIIASNTSSISITSLSANLKNPERFLGIHFFNPAPLMPLVEVIPGLLTKENLAREIYDLMKSWNKIPVIAKDIPGFIVNRIARPFYGEALRIVEENLATPQEVDDAMKTFGNFKMGPFELMDLIGIDVNFAVTTTIYKDYFYDSKYKPSLLQQRMCEAKLLGRKTGKGFYDYSQEVRDTGFGIRDNETEIKTEEIINEKETESVENQVELNENQETNTFSSSRTRHSVASQKPSAKSQKQKVFHRIIAMLINEAVEAKRLNIASDEDIELAMQKGVNYPKGLLNWGKELGFDFVSKTLQNLYDEYREERYRQSPLLRKM